MLSIVSRTRFISWRLAPSTASPMGTPCPSVRTLRFTPLFALSVGLDPLFFRPAALFPSHHPGSTTPIPGLATRQTVRPLPARTSQTHPPPPTPENDHAPWNGDKSLFHPGHPIDSLFAKQRNLIIACRGIIWRSLAFRFSFGHPSTIPVIRIGSKMAGEVVSPELAHG
jgi:hypothetical protein